MYAGGRETQGPGQGQGDLLLDRRLGYSDQHHSPGRPLFCLQTPPHHLLRADQLHEHLLHLQEHTGHHIAGNSDNNRRWVVC